MGWFKDAISFIAHLDDHLKQMIVEHGAWIYGILFAIVFGETGFIILPFLPGDSLLFAAGVLSHPENGNLNPLILFPLFIGAALLGDNVNYFVGNKLGRRLFNNDNSKLFKKSHLDSTHAFLEKHGPKAIILARFVPIVRTFMPFVAGMGDMEYPRFIRFSVIGAFIWVTVCYLGGYMFGSIPIVKKNFEYAILLIVLVTILPIGIEIIRHKKGKKGKDDKPEVVPESVA